jgi:leader peptidase (prepilin peptidase)/N-methyltransferase
MISIVVVIFGLLVGSFLNVCIVRIPRGRSIITPPSHCPRCKEHIRFYDNIPLVSFAVLRGRCRSCGERIPWRYPAVELTNAVLYVMAYREFGLGGETLMVMAICSSLLVITFIDLDHMIIPDAITLPGMLVGLTIAPLVMSSLNDPLPFHLSRLLPHAGPYLVGFLNSCIGLLFGAAPLFAIGWVWERLRNIEAMGGGDVKLMGMVGSFLGWKSALLTIMIGALTGSIVGLILILLRRHKAQNVIPFGPFLAAGTLITIFYGFDILNWYLGLLRI